MLCMLLTESVWQSSGLFVIPMTVDERDSNLPNMAESSRGFELGFECMSVWLQITAYDGLALDQVFS